ITETAIAGDTPAGISLLRALRRIGIRVAVDDFGSGYSSLGQLRRLPVDLLKIDRTFLADAGSPEAASFLRAIVELARGLGLGVVAEGIESDQQLALVRETRCGLGQGWLWARGMPLDALRAWLRDGVREGLG
ncbi:MAG: EAL domain-containing protein, partial [Thermoleophilia bacterium]